MATRCVVVALAAVAGIAVLGTPASAVANGDSVPDGQYGFATRLAITGTSPKDRPAKPSICSGVLIDPVWVMTAGHCFTRAHQRYSGPLPRSSTATVGRAEVSGTGGHVVGLREVRQAQASDVALVRLETPVPDVRPVRLATTDPTVGAVLRITGWGVTGRSGGLPQRLQTGQVKIGSVGSRTVGVRGYAPEAKTCACASDSGAPYFLERPGQDPLLVAVENTGPSCPHDQEELGYRTDLLTGWVAATTATSPYPEVPPDPPSAGSRLATAAGWTASAVAVLALATGVLLIAARRRRA